MARYFQPKLDHNGLTKRHTISNTYATDTNNTDQTRTSVTNWTLESWRVDREEGRGSGGGGRFKRFIMKWQ